MSRVARSAQLACLAFLWIGCSDGSSDGLDGTEPDGGVGKDGGPDGGPSEDGGADAPDGGMEDVGPADMGPEDMGVDLGPLPPSFGELFGACFDDGDCPGPGGRCRTAGEGYPYGYCTRTCDGPNDRTACEVERNGFTVYHHCAQRTEDPAETFSCDFNCLSGLDCGRDGYSCVVGALPGGGICIPVCSSDDQCGPGSFCNRYSGQCQDEPPMDPMMSGLSGLAGRCDGPEDCASGRCISAGTANAPTGWAEGYCLSYCTLPAGFNNNDFFAGDALPPSTCPGQNPVCIPVSNRSNSRLDLGNCYQGCVENDDCRDGYACQRQFGSRQFDNGICVPGPCSGLIRVDCPENYTCVDVQTPQGVTSRCAPPQ